MTLVQAINAATIVSVAVGPIFVPSRSLGSVEDCPDVAYGNFRTQTDRAVRGARGLAGADYVVPCSAERGYPKTSRAHGAEPYARGGSRSAARSTDVAAKSPPPPSCRRPWWRCP